MPNHIWKPVDADEDGFTAQITYQNELGEEFIYSTDTWECDPRAICWPSCSGDWPGCRASCRAFSVIQDKRYAEMAEYEKIPPYDPFSFMLNHLCSIDDNNCYVEEFDTLDGTHWEIAVNVEKQLLELLDEETQSEEYE